MRITLIFAVACAFILPACKSHKQPEDMQQLQKEVPDAKPTLHVAEDDPRYVPSGEASRQIHYYSEKNDTTYVIDERTGKVVRTFKSKEMPGVVVIDKPEYQPPPLEATPAEEGSAEGCAPEEEAGEEAIEEVEESAGEGCGSE